MAARRTNDCNSVFAKQCRLSGRDAIRSTVAVIDGLVQSIAAVYRPHISTHHGRHDQDWVLVRTYGLPRGRRLQCRRHDAASDERLAVRQESVVPLVHELHVWMQDQRASLSRHDAVAKAINYLLNDWDGFTTFLSDGRVCLTNNCAERQVRGIARGRRTWLFVGSDRGGQRAAMLSSLIRHAD